MLVSRRKAAPGLPPGMPPRPDLGRLMMGVGFLLRPTEFLDRCQATCGDWFTLRPARDRLVAFTTDPDAVRQIFTADPDVLRAGEANVVLAPILGAGSTLLLDGPEHLRHRRLLLPPFHGDRMRAHVETMEQVAERHVATWRADGSFAVIPSMQAITLEIIERIVFGVDDSARRESLARPLRELLDTLASRRRVLLLALTAERTGPLSPWQRLAERRREAETLLLQEIRARRALTPEPAGEERTDVLSLLLAARDEQGEPLSDGELVDELMTLLVAGHETTATALAWTLERLVRHPDALARAASGDAAYLDAVIRETLRLRPVVPAVVRKLSVPYSIGGWDLPAGVHVAPSIYLLHRRPDLYPEPTRFRPERFLERQYGTYEWIPFGGGTRRCLGAAFALTEMKAVLEVILRDVTLRPQPGAESEGTTRRAITFAPTAGGRISLA